MRRRRLHLPRPENEDGAAPDDELREDGARGKDPLPERLSRTRGRRHYSCRSSGSGLVVLVEEAAESVTAADVVGRCSFSLLVPLGRAVPECAMWPFAVVVV